MCQSPHPNLNAFSSRSLARKSFGGVIGGKGVDRRRRLFKSPPTRTSRSRADVTSCVTVAARRKPECCNFLLGKTTYSRLSGRLLSNFRWSWPLIEIGGDPNFGKTARTKTEDSKVYRFRSRSELYWPGQQELSHAESDVCLCRGHSVA